MYAGNKGTKWRQSVGLGFVLDCRIPREAGIVGGGVGHVFFEPVYPSR